MFEKPSLTSFTMGEWVVDTSWNFLNWSGKQFQSILTNTFCYGGPPWPPQIFQPPQKIFTVDLNFLFANSVALANL